MYIYINIIQNIFKINAILFDKFVTFFLLFTCPFSKLIKLMLYLLYSYIFYRKNNIIPIFLE